jgi:ubiquinone/menaquinone biosynthesis C-methylase UbiE
MPFEELKQRQSVMWGNGPYERVTDTIGDLQQRVVERLDPNPGERWLDLATGTGAVARLAAKAGASVTGIDLAPVLIETAKRDSAGFDIDFQLGDCENLEGVEPASFDVASSTCGIMFAPDHEATAAELARVVCPGGRLGLANWTPEGGVGQMFQMMRPFQPPPPEGVPSPFEWGKRDRVEELLGNAFDQTIEEHLSPLTIANGEEYWEFFSSSYGPTKTLAESLDDDRREEFHRTWVDFFESKYGSSGGPVNHAREYLLVLGTRR